MPEKRFRVFAADSGHFTVTEGYDSRDGGA
jgi:hypothetical protein